MSVKSLSDELSRPQRLARVEGVTTLQDSEQRFRGTITLEARSDCIYYTWKLTGEDGSHLGGVSRPVSYRLVPEGEDRFEFALAHAVKGINSYRVGRKRPYHLEHVEWLE